MKAVFIYESSNTEVYLLENNSTLTKIWDEDSVDYYSHSLQIKKNENYNELDLIIHEDENFEFHLRGITINVNDHIILIDGYKDLESRIPLFHSSEEESILDKMFTIYSWIDLSTIIGFTIDLNVSKNTFTTKTTTSCTVTNVVNLNVMDENLSCSAFSVTVTGMVSISADSTITATEGTIVINAEEIKLQNSKLIANSNNIILNAPTITIENASELKSTLNSIRFTNTNSIIKILSESTINTKTLTINGKTITIDNASLTNIMNGNIILNEALSLQTIDVQATNLELRSITQSVTITNGNVNGGYWLIEAPSSRVNIAGLSGSITTMIVNGLTQGVSYCNADVVINNLNITGTASVQHGIQICDFNSPTLGVLKGTSSGNFYGVNFSGSSLFNTIITGGSSGTLAAVYGPNLNNMNTVQIYGTSGGTAPYSVQLGTNKSSVTYIQSFIRGNGNGGVQINPTGTATLGSITIEGTGNTNSGISIVPTILTFAGSSNLTFTGTGPVGVSLTGNNSNLKNCRITGNSMGTNAIVIQATTNFKLESCTMEAIVGNIKFVTPKVELGGPVTVTVRAINNEINFDNVNALLALSNFVFTITDGFLRTNGNFQTSGSTSSGIVVPNGGRIKSNATFAHTGNSRFLIGLFSEENMSWTAGNAQLCGNYGALGAIRLTTTTSNCAGFTPQLSFNAIQRVEIPQSLNSPDNVDLNITASQITVTNSVNIFFKN